MSLKDTVFHENALSMFALSFILESEEQSLLFVLRKRLIDLWLGLCSHLLSKQLILCMQSSLTSNNKNLMMDKQIIKCK